MPSLPLRDLFKSDKPDRVTHEIILVHGFKSRPKTKSRSAECRRTLKSWILKEIHSVETFVNVRMFAFDSEHILHTGRPALHETAVEFSNSIAVTNDPTSPLFCSVTDGDRGRSARAAIFVAHGMGLWVVKESLMAISAQTNRINPTGLFFFDIPEALVAPNPIVNVSSRDVTSQYLNEFSETFHMELDQSKLHGLQAKIQEIDAHYHNFSMATYGQCEQITGLVAGAVSQGTHAARSMCHNIWMSSTPALTFEDRLTFKEFVQNISGMLKGCRPNPDSSLGKLADLGLGEQFGTAMSTRTIHGLMQEPPAPTEVLTITIEPAPAPNGPESGTENANTSLDTPTNNPIGGTGRGHSTGSTTTNNNSCHSGESKPTEAEKGPCSRCPRKGNSTSVHTGSLSGPADNPGCSLGENGSKDITTTLDSLISFLEERESSGAETKDEPKSANKSSEDSGGNVTRSETPEEDSKMTKGKGKERMNPLRLNPFYSSHKNGTPPKVYVGDQENHAGSSASNDSGKIDKEFDLDTIIAQRDKAVAEGDEEALRSAIEKLKLLKLHLQENLAKDDHRIFIVQLEIVKTSIEYGWWNGCTMSEWGEIDISEMEDQVREAYDGLKKSLGSHHRATMGALALLLALGVSMLDFDDFPVADIQATHDMMMQKLTAEQEDARKPGVLLRALRRELKIESKCRAKS